MRALAGRDASLLESMGYSAIGSDVAKLWKSVGVERGELTPLQQEHIGALFKGKLMPSLSAREKLRIAGLALNPRFRRKSIREQVAHLREKFPDRAPWEVYPWGSTIFSTGILRPLLLARKTSIKFITEQSVPLRSELQLKVGDPSNNERKESNDRKIAIELWVKLEFPKYDKSGWVWNDEIVHYFSNGKIAAYGDLIPPKDYYSRYRSLFRPAPGIESSVGPLNKYDGRREWYADIESIQFTGSILPSFGKTPTAGADGKLPEPYMEESSEYAETFESVDDRSILDEPVDPKMVKNGTMLVALYEFTADGANNEISAQAGDKLKAMLFESTGSALTSANDWIYVINMTQGGISPGWFPFNHTGRT